MKNAKSGFTIVELLIVIVVIGILAAITIVAFNGIRQRADTTAMHSDLSGAAKHMEIAKVDSTSESYPSNLPSDVKTSPGVILQLAQVASGQSFCINAYRSSPYTVASFDSATKTIRGYPCPGAAIGSAVGGTIPTAPRGTDLAPDLSTWAYTGGMTYNGSTKEISFNTGAGEAMSPLIRIDAPTSVTLKVESYATTSAPSFTPNSGVYFSSYYYAADGVTPVANTSGYTNNGNAQGHGLSAWTQRTWTTPTGPGIVYIKFAIRASPTTYTSNNQMRSVTVTAN